MIQDQPMVPEIKARWIEALNSGDYQQTNGILHQVNPVGSSSYCCLGVLCEIAYQEGAVEREKTADGNYRYASEADGDNAFLPDKVMEWSGVRDWSGMYYLDDDERKTLVQHNDDGDPFSVIAEIVEAHF